MNDKQNYIASACAGKVSFATFTLANAVIKRNGDKPREGRTSYHCLHCHQWHLGTDNGQRARERYERKSGK